MEATLEALTQAQIARQTHKHVNPFPGPHPLVGVVEVEAAIRAAIRGTVVYARTQRSVAGYDLRARVAGYCLASWLNVPSDINRTFNLAVALQDLAPNALTGQACKQFVAHIEDWPTTRHMTRRQGEKLEGFIDALRSKVSDLL